MRLHSGFALVPLLGVAAFPPCARSSADRPAAQGAGAVRQAGAGTPARALDKIVRQYTRDLLPVSSLGVLFRAFDTAAVTVGAAP